MLDKKGLGDYGNWIGQTAWDVYYSVKGVGGWQNVFPGALPSWASRVRQYFNLNPMTLKLLDQKQSSEYLEQVQTALPASARAIARRKELQSRGMGISAYVPTSTQPGTPIQKPDPRAAIDTLEGKIGTAFALSGDVYEDTQGRRIWFQMVPGAAIYHTGEKITSPMRQAIAANQNGQARCPVFKLISPDGTGGSMECCIKNPFGASWGQTTIGALNDEVDVSRRFIEDSVNQGSYNYAETIEKGLPAHQRLDVDTDPMIHGYFVEPPDLFRFSELYMRRFPPNDPLGKPLAAQTGRAP